MGTSKSNSGPRDKIPLLPDWALPSSDITGTQLEEEAQEEAPLDSTDPAQENEYGEDDAAQDEESHNLTDSAVGEDLAPVVDRSSWRSARILLGKAVKKTGDRRPAFRAAAQSYVRAQGGARRSSQTSRSGRYATGRLGGFLADVARRGLNAALESLNLSSIVGKDAQTVFAAISNALSPGGASPEEAVAREAVNDVLADIYEQFVGDDGDLSKLDALTRDDVAKAIMDSITSYIYRRWLQDLGKQIEKKAISPAEAVGLERETKLFVKDSVKLDFKTIDPLSINWKTDGNTMIENIYMQAYTLFGAGQ